MNSSPLSHQPNTIQTLLNSFKRSKRTTMLAFPSLLTPPTNLVYTIDETIYHNDLHTQAFNTRHFTNDHQQEEATHLNLDPYSLDDLLFSPFNQEALPPPPAQTYMGGAQMSAPPGVSSGVRSPLVATMVEEKKLNHNASERNRRKRVNSLYASLRALLPFADQTKRLSIPSTIAKVLDYIPELQSEVEGLIKMKEGLLPNTMTSTKTSPSLPTSSCSVQATQLGNGEISIQITTIKSIRAFFVTSQILQELEEEGVAVVDVSSSESPAGRVFHHIHIMVLEARRDIKCEALKEKLLSLCQEWEKSSRWVN